MKIGCGEWGFRELPIDDHFKICKDFRFTTLEIGIGGEQRGRLPEHMAEKEIERFKELCLDYKIKTPYCCIENDFTLNDNVAHEKMVIDTLNQIKLASKLGVTHIRLFAGFTPVEKIKEYHWHQLFAAFEKCNLLCQKYGIQIGIETHGTISIIDGVAVHQRTVSTDPKALQILLSGLPSTVGINYDPGNLKAVAPYDKTYSLEILKNRINYCHLKDWKRSGEGWVACAPGDDDLDYAKLIPKINFDGVYLIEYEPVADIIEGLQRTLDYLSNIFPLEFV